jgi:hypothetical protein
MTTGQIRPLDCKSEFVPCGLALTVLAHQAADLEKWTRSCRGNSPRVCGPQCKARQSRTDLSQQSCQADFGKELCYRFET